MGQQRGETKASKWAKEKITNWLTKKENVSQSAIIAKKTKATNEANKIWGQGKGGSGKD